MTPPPSSDMPLLAVRDLVTTFHRHGAPLTVVNGVSFSVAPGEVLGIVGESGSGKSITLRSILGIITPHGQVSGSIRWQGRELVGLPEPALREIRGRDIAMIFQEPMSSLNPLLTVALQIEENLKAHTTLGRAERRRRVLELLDMVGIPAAAARQHDYPHQFSGGMRQRVMIAIALASSPRLLLADEPTTALDVTIQDQILRLILDLRRDLGMAVILVTHDLSVVAQSCDRVAVMYAGRLVETGGVRQVLRQPHHPYTRGLLQSVPADGGATRVPLYSIDGTPPALDRLPPGCAFAPRCRESVAACVGTAPPLVQTMPGQFTACHLQPALTLFTGDPAHV